MNELEGDPMANKDNKEDSISENRLLMNQIFQLDALTRLLLKKGVISEGELSRQVEAIRKEYDSKRKASK